MTATTAPFALLADGTEQPLRPAAPVRYSVGAIAHHLAQINRFTGACERPYSVAEHSLLCADIAEDAGATPELQLCCLLHDAHEALLGDVSSPVKAMLGSTWAQLEYTHANALREHLGMQEWFRCWADEVLDADLIAMATERRDLLPYDDAVHRPWPVLHDVTPAQIDLTGAWRQHRHWSEWREDFLRRYQQLKAQCE